MDAYTLAVLLLCVVFVQVKHYYIPAEFRDDVQMLERNICRIIFFNKFVITGGSLPKKY
jgi:hypothetical protein